MILAAAADAVPVTTQTLYLIGAVMVGTATTVLFVARGFSENRRLFYRVISLHNKEDDDRFQTLSDEIWQLHLRNARRDGDEPPARKTFPRRRYLAETIDEAGAAELNGGPRV